MNTTPRHPDGQPQQTPRIGKWVVISVAAVGLMVAIGLIRMFTPTPEPVPRESLPNLEGTDIRDLSAEERSKLADLVGKAPDGADADTRALHEAGADVMRWILEARNESDAAASAYIDAGGERPEGLVDVSSIDARLALLDRLMVSVDVLDSRSQGATSRLIDQLRARQVRESVITPFANEFAGGMRLDLQLRLRAAERLMLMLQRKRFEILRATIGSWAYDPLSQDATFSDTAPADVVASYKSLTISMNEATDLQRAVSDEMRTPRK